MQGVRLVVAYDGSDFSGWQRQRGQRTVQGELERAVTAMAGAPVKVRGASRTDAGVHAHGQVAAFDVERSIPANGWLRGLNSSLAGDVAVVSAAPCAVEYEPRFDAVAKTYRYLIHLGEAPDPLLRRRAWHLGPRRSRPGPPERAAGVSRGPFEPRRWLDLDGMRAAAAALEGTHDFAALRAAGDTRDNTVRTLTDVRVLSPWAQRPDLVAIEVRGTAFLQHMVRILAGTLVEVGRGRRTPADVAALLLDGSSRAAAGETAPPHGLYLVEIELGRRRAANEG